MFRKKRQINILRQNAGMIAGLSPSTPLISDADTGYIPLRYLYFLPAHGHYQNSFGGPVMCARTLTLYDRAGVAALHIEDQVISSLRKCANLLVILSNIITNRSKRSDAVTFVSTPNFKIQAYLLFSNFRN